MSNRVHIACFPMSVLQVQTLWRTTPDFVSQVTDPRHYLEIADLAERGRFDYLFLPDKNTVNAPLGQDATRDGNSWPEPLTLMSYLAAATERIGLVATSSTAWGEPFRVAREFQTLDHLSRGRAGWNAVSSHPGLEDHNFGHRPSLDGDARGRMHEEFIRTVIDLWNSWDDDAIVADREEQRWAKPGSVRSIDHRGEFFDVAGPLNIHRSPQGRPIIVEAGASERFMRRAALTADAVFCIFASQAETQQFTRRLRELASAAGRGTNDVRIMPSVTFSFSGESAPMPGHLHFGGSGADIAAQMLEFVNSGAADGFTLLPTLMPQDLRRFVDEVVPVLQREGAVPSEYEGTTLRENLRLSPRPTILGPRTGQPRIPQRN